MSTPASEQELSHAVTFSRAASPSLPLSFAQGFFLIGLVLVALFVRRWRKRKRTPSGASSATPTTTSSTVGDREHAAKLQTLLDRLTQTELPTDMTQHPDMKRLQTLLTDGDAELNTLQSEYAQNLERLQSLTQRSNAPSQDYRALLTEAEAVQAFNERLSANAQQLEQTLNLANRLDAVSVRLKQFETTYSAVQSDTWPDTERVLNSLRQRYDEAGELASAEPSTALGVLKTLDTDLSLSEDAVIRLVDTEKRLFGFQLRLEAWREEGYLLQDKDKRLAELRQNVDVALGLLQRGEPKILDAQMDEVVDLTDKLIDETEGGVRLHASNQTRLLELKTAHQDAAMTINNARRAFAASAEVAPSNWRDIRGNGGEAQKSAKRALAQYHKAQTLNRLDGAQAFEEARLALARGFEELSKVKQLCATIHERFGYLADIKRVALAQLQQVQSDAATHSQLSLTQTAEPADLTVTELVNEVKRELATAQPDCLKALDLLQRAAALCESSASTGDQAARTKHLQTRLVSKKLEATVALKRVMSYARVHSRDLQAPTLELLERAQTQYREASTAERLTVMQHAAASATKAFEAAERDVESLDTLRSEAAACVGAARASYEALRRFSASASSPSADTRRSFYALEAQLPEYKAGLSRAELESLKRDVQTFEQSVQDLLSAEGRSAEDKGPLRLERERVVIAERRRQAAERSRYNAVWGRHNADGW